MNKPNIFKTSNFHLDIGDIVHIIIDDETGATASINLTSEAIQNAGVPPQTPIALDATDITSSGFTANWSLMQDATGFYLDVAEDVDFTIFVDGYNNKSMGTSITEAVVSTDPSAPIVSNKNYYYRVRAVNSNGTSGDSNIVALTTLAESLTDIDGNVYSYVTIGSLQWVAEGLRTTRYNDGTAISNLTTNGAWQADTTGAYCWFNNDIANKDTYGAIYNGYAVASGKLAPAGWRVATAADWASLVASIGTYDNAGGILKENGTIHWAAPNTGATDAYGFSALPGGFRSSSGSFLLETTYSGILTSTSIPVSHLQGFGLSSSAASLTSTSFALNDGGYVRFVRDI